MNKKLLRETKRNVLTHYEQFDMQFWWAKRTGVPRCGTTACLAGWVITLGHHTDNLIKGGCVIDSRFDQGSVFGTTFSTAKIRTETMRLLDIDGDAFERLCYDSNWPTKYSVAYDELSRKILHAWGSPKEKKALLKQRAQVAAERIDFFIATNGTDVETPKLKPMTGKDIVVGNHYINKHHPGFTYLGAALMTTCKSPLTRKHLVILETGRVALPLNLKDKKSIEFWSGFTPA